MTSAGLPRVYLVRHGETAWTLTGQHTGRSDIPLTRRGEQEAVALQKELHELRVSDVFTSPLMRARRTCELAGFRPVAAIDPNLAEWDYGEYEGRTTADIRANQPTWRLFEDGCPKGESAGDVGARADQVIVRIHQCAGSVLLFAHRDILRVITARWLRLAPVEGRRFYLATGSLSLLGYDHTQDEPVVRAWNRVE